MKPHSVAAQLRTTDLARSIRFYTDVLGLDLMFEYRDFYAGLSAGGQMLHLKLVDNPDKSHAEIAEGEHFHLYFGTDDARALAASIEAKGVALTKPPQQTPWGTLEFALHDDEGHVLYFGEVLKP